LFTTPGLGQFISGAILFDETLNQKTKDGKLFPQVLLDQGILPGIKVDAGLKDLPGTGEQVCTGLDGLFERATKYYNAGCRFAKWRAAYTIDVKAGKPCRVIIDTQARDLARYAKICQAAKLVPIVEPEVMMDGDHTIEDCARISEQVWSAVVTALHEYKVFLEGCLLKPNMITPGQKNPAYKTTSPHVVASYTVRCLKRTIPAAIPGIMFLSGGQNEEEATLNLDAMNRLEGTPWRLSFSYGRALQSSCLKAWLGKSDNVKDAQATFITRAQANSEAQLGKYKGGAGGDAAKVSLFEADYKY
jgi:fructose-bisphosphate aldolase class I